MATETVHRYSAEHSRSGSALCGCPDATSPVATDEKLVTCQKCRAVIAARRAAARAAMMTSRA